MAYFPNAFGKVFTPKVAGFKNPALGTDPKVHTSALTAGDFAFVSPSTYETVATADADVKKNPMVILAQGSYHSSDTIGSHGGYKESIKSKGINPHYVHRFYKVAGRAAVAPVYEVTGGTPFVEGKTYNLRIDIKGSPVLRTLNRNGYKTVSAYTGCAADPANPVAVDPATVFVQFALDILRDPILSQLLKAEVRVVDATPGTTTTLTTVADLEAYVANATPADITATLILKPGYVDTKFGVCSFDIKDHYELEPIVVTTAQLVDESGDPCSGFVQVTLTETTAPVYPQGVAETATRELILDARYRQEPFNSDVRRRQIEGIDETQLNVINTALVDRYYILHSVPRKANPSSTLDSDQYLLCIIVPSGSDLSAFTTWFQDYLDSAGRGIKLETLA